MKKILSTLVMVTLFCTSSLFAQVGRPEKIENSGAPKITARNSLDKDVATLSERMAALENRMAKVEAENAALKNENAALKAENANQQNQINDQVNATKANYKILENYINTVKNKMDSQIGTFRITGAISNKSLGTSGSVNLLMGVHE